MGLSLNSISSEDYFSYTTGLKTRLKSDEAKVMGSFAASCSNSPSYVTVQQIRQSKSAVMCHSVAYFQDTCCCC